MNRVLLCVFLDNAVRCALMVVYGWEGLRLGGTAAVAWLFVGMHATGMLLGPALGRAVDRMGSCSALRLASGLGCVFLLTFCTVQPSLAQTSWPLALAACAVVTAAAGLLAAPALQGLLQAACKPGEAMRGAARNASASAAGFVAGAAGVGCLMDTAGASTALLVCAAVSALVGLLAADPGETDQARGARASGPLSAGEMRVLLARPSMRQTAFGIVVAYTAFHLVGAILPAFASRALEADATWFGLLRSAWSVGAIATGVMLSLLPATPSLAAASVRMALAGAAFVWLSRAPGVQSALLLMLLTGALWASVRAMLDAIVMAEVPARLIGRYRNRAMAWASAVSLTAFACWAQLPGTAVRIPFMAAGIGLVVGGLLVSPRFRTVVVSLGHPGEPRLRE